MKKLVFLSELFVLFLFVALILFIIYVSLHSYSIEQTLYAGQDRLNNPLRGFYTQIDCRHPEFLDHLVSENQRLALAAYDISPYRDCPLSEEKLQELKIFLSHAEELGISCIFRAAYGFDILDSNDADSLERIKEHVSQIAPVLNEYKDTVCCVQAGFFGPWGEWHTSRFLENNPVETQVSNRNYLLTLLLENLDSSIPINVRRPRFIRDAKKAGLDTGRIGFHNDGLLASDNDLGTYDDADYDRAAEMKWLSRQPLGMNGGEMPALSRYTAVSNVLKEFPLMQISYLNIGYNTEVLDSWKTETVDGQNAYDYIENHLGYRFYVSHIEYRETWRGITLTAALVNEGFAPIGKGFSASFALIKDGKEFLIPIHTDLYTIKNGESKPLKVSLPEEYRSSSFQIGIKIQKDDTAVQLSNKENNFENGTNYLFSVSREN